MATLVKFRLIASSTTIWAWMPSWAAKRKMESSGALPSHCVIEADPAAGVMILVIPFPSRWRSPAMTTPVFTDPITPQRSGMEASSWAMRAPRSFLASTSRASPSTFIFEPPTSMPPFELISLMASLAPSRIETPMGAEPPLKGPVIASLMESAAKAGRESPEINRIANSLIMSREPLPGESERAAEAITTGESFSMSIRPLVFPPGESSIEIERGEVALLVEDRAPHLVRGLVLAHPERKLSAGAQVEALDVLERVDDLLRVRVWAGPLDSLDEEARGQVSLERHEVRLFGGGVFLDELLVVEHRGRAGGRERYHLGDDGALRVPGPEPYQFVRQRHRPHEGDVREEHVRGAVPHLLDEPGRGFVGRHHHHRPDLLALRELIHSIADLGGIALVADPQDCRRIDAVLAHGAGDALEPGVAVGVLLGEDGDLAGLEPADVDQPADDGGRLLGVARPVVEDVAVGRVLAQERRARESAEEEDLVLDRVRSGDRGGGSSDVADDTGDMALLDQLLHRLDGAGGFVSVVERDEAQLATVDASGIVDRVEGHLHAGLHRAAQLLGRAGERGAHPEGEIGKRLSTLRRGGSRGHRRRCLVQAAHQEEADQPDRQDRCCGDVRPDRLRSRRRRRRGRVGRTRADGGGSGRRRRESRRAARRGLRRGRGRCRPDPRRGLHERRFVDVDGGLEQDLRPRREDVALRRDAVALDAERSVFQLQRDPDGINALQLPEGSREELPFADVDDPFLPGGIVEPHRDLLAALAIELHEVGEVCLGKIAGMRHGAQVNATGSSVQDFRYTWTSGGPPQR